MQQMNPNSSSIVVLQKLAVSFVLVTATFNGCVNGLYQCFGESVVESDFVSYAVKHRRPLQRTNQ